jgi:hypothetical protein
MVVVENEAGLDAAAHAIRLALEGTAEPELLVSRFLVNGASDGWESTPA